LSLDHTHATDTTHTQAFLRRSYEFKTSFYLHMQCKQNENIESNSQRKSNLMRHILSLETKSCAGSPPWISIYSRTDAIILGQHVLDNDCPVTITCPNHWIMDRLYNHGYKFFVIQLSVSVNVRFFNHFL